ncbi:MAG TPA: hypothetical protein VI461_01465 [Chitinophagaceae bacterium]|nr:hypothetical protein [Chitinophagaceae bacterium]
MNQQPPPPPQGASLFEMDMDAEAQNHLKNISRWGKFIGITLLILVALSLFGLASSYEQIIDRVRNLMDFNDKAAGILIGVLAFIGVLCIIWLIYLLRACSLIKQGLISQNSDRIAEGFKYMKTIFVISIIFSALSILSTLFSMLN